MIIRVIAEERTKTIKFCYKLFWRFYIVYSIDSFKNHKISLGYSKK